MRKTKIAIIASFIIIIGFPTLLQLVGVEMRQPNSENRDLAKMPQFSFEETHKAEGIGNFFGAIYKDAMRYKNKFHNYYEDRFVLKYILFENYKLIQRGVFAQEPIPQKVVEGTDGWMFLGNSYSYDIAESKGIIVFKEKSLEQIKANLLHRNSWLENRNIKYYVAIAPNKLSMYGEYLPIKQSEKKTKREQLLEIMKYTNLPIIDMAEFLKKTPDTILYEKTGSHWNDLGAFMGYQALMKHIVKDFPEVKPLERKDFTIIPKITYQEDIIKMLNETRLEKQLAFISITPEHAKPVASELSLPPYSKMRHEDYEQRYKSNVNRLKVLMLRDSFSSAIIKYLKENFGEIVFVWTDDFNKEIIEKEQPDIIIQEIVEREMEVLSKK